MNNIKTIDYLKVFSDRVRKLGFGIAFDCYRDNQICIRLYHGFLNVKIMSNRMDVCIDGHPAGVISIVRRNDEDIFDLLEVVVKTFDATRTLYTSEYNGGSECPPQGSSSPQDDCDREEPDLNRR